MIKSFAFIGHSGSGKDTATQALTGCEVIHPIRDIKRFYEAYYEFAEGSFDTAEGKARKLSPTSDLTVGEFQVKLWEFFKEVDPSVSLYGFERDLRIARDNNNGTISVTGIRSIAEAELVNIYLPETRWFLILRPGCNGLNSDQNLDDIIEYLSVNKEITPIFNSTTKAKFLQKVSILTQDLDPEW